MSKAIDMECLSQWETYTINQFCLQQIRPSSTHAHTFCYHKREQSG